MARGSIRDSHTVSHRYQLFFDSSRSGDPVYYLAGQSGDEAYYVFIRAKFGLDEPLTTQLWVNLGSVLRGDLVFRSLSTAGVAVIFSRVSHLMMVFMRFLSLRSAEFWSRGSAAGKFRLDRSLILSRCSDISSHRFRSDTFTAFFRALPWIVSGAGICFGESGFVGNQYFLDVLTHLALPALTLGTVQIAQIMRLTRTNMLNIVAENYITTARERRFRAQSFIRTRAPQCAFAGCHHRRQRFGNVLSGAVLTETVFAYPGLGRLMLEVLEARDYPVLMGLFLLISIAVAAMNF